MENLQSHFHENVKHHVIQTYLQLAMGLMRLEGVLVDDRFPWKKGSPKESPLPAQVSQFLNQIVLPYYFNLFEAEENK